jgi:hypothetical protein
MAVLATFELGIGDEIDFAIEWAPWLGPNSVASATWTVASGELVVVSQSETATKCSVRLGTGVSAAVGAKYLATCSIVDTLGQHKHSAIAIKVVA